MASAVWKGHLTFGLVSMPVKLYRAARPEKVSFRQLHAATGGRVRQTLMAEPEVQEEAPPLRGAAESRGSSPFQPFLAPVPARSPKSKPVAPSSPPPPPETEPESPREVSRSEIVKGYEYARDRYVTISKDELAAITPQTAREMQILEFVRLEEVDPIYYETSYYVAPDKGGDLAYALLLEALRQSGYVGVAQVAMHNREHVVIIRPGRTGMVLHTMFYETEIRKDDEYRTDHAAISKQELELATLLIRNLAAPFDPAKYRDTYREKIEALIQAKISGDETVEAPAPKAAPVVNILEALQRSLATSQPAAAKPKPPAAESGRRTANRKTGRK